MCAGAAAGARRSTTERRWSVAPQSSRVLHQAGRTWSRRNWSREVVFAPEDYYQPKHTGSKRDGLASLVRAVADATAADQEIHPIGSGWAFEDLAASDGAIISLEKLDRQLDYVVGNGGAGLTDGWRQELADPNGRRLVHVEAGIRIAGSRRSSATWTSRCRHSGVERPRRWRARCRRRRTAGTGPSAVPRRRGAIHRVGEDGKEFWIEPSTEERRLTVDDRLAPLLPCADAEIVRDDAVFDGALVACGRFGVIYSLVLEVVRAFRVVEAVITPSRGDVLQALRDGVTAATPGQPFQPLFELLARTALPAGIADAIVDTDPHFVAPGNPYFVQVLFNSQNPEQVWVHRRWKTTNPNDIPAPDNVVTAEMTDDATAALLVPAVNVALDTAAVTATATIPLGGLGIAAFIELEAKPVFNATIASRRVLAGLGRRRSGRCDLEGADRQHLVPWLNGEVIGGRMARPIQEGRRGPHYLMTSGTRADSDSESYKSASIEVVFDATTMDYLGFLDEILPVAPKFKQAGYVSLRPSLRSQAPLSMHHVRGSHAMSIEIASLQGLPGNASWMSFVHDRAVARGGRPHWGQYNKLDALDVALLYRSAIDEWREGLLMLSGTSTRFSNAFTRARGLEPVSIAREVTATAKDRGRITHLCNPSAAWSPVSRRQAISEIKSGTVKYFVRGAQGVVPIHVVGGRYLRTAPDATSANNLDALPDC